MALASLGPCRPLDGHDLEPCITTLAVPPGVDGPGREGRLEEMLLDQIEDPAIGALVELAREETSGVAQAVEVVDPEDFRPGAGCGPARM